MSKSNNRVEVHPMKKWLRNNCHYIPVGMDVDFDTSRQMLGKFKKERWKTRETKTEVRIYISNNKNNNNLSVDNPKNSESINTALESLNNTQRSNASKKRELKRNSKSTLIFKSEIEELLDGANSEIAYSMKKDLAAMTNMAFYKYRPKKIALQLTNKEIVKGYCHLLKNNNDIDFSKKVLMQLNKNQSQTIRKIAKKRGDKKDIWEHVIPVKIIVDEIIKMLENNNLTDIDKLLNLYEKAGQCAVSKSEDKKLNFYKSSMPADWNWRDPNVDIYARYSAVGIVINNEPNE